MSFARSFWTHDRGGSAPRRRGGRGGKNFPHKKEQIKPDIVKNPLGKLKETIHASDSTLLVKDLSRTATITDCRYLASYNWLNRSAPTIAVPGKSKLAQFWVRVLTAIRQTPSMDTSEQPTTLEERQRRILP